MTYQEKLDLIEDADITIEEVSPDRAEHFRHVDTGEILHTDYYGGGFRWRTYSLEQGLSYGPLFDNHEDAVDDALNHLEKQNV